MRTENSSSPASAAARLRAQLARVRRSAAASAAPVRWLAVLGALAIVGALGYLANTGPAAGKYLGGDQQFSADEMEKIKRELDKQHINYRVTDRRIGVSSDSYDDAMEVVAKLDIGPRFPSEIRDRENMRGGRLWETSVEAQRHELEAQEKILEAMIRNLDGIVSAYVTMHRTKTVTGARPSMTATAFVWLETDGDRELSPKTVQSIQNIVVGNAPDLKPDAVTVFDRTGRHYAGNPEINEISRTRAREQELAQQILEQLDYIKGMRVRVQLVSAPAPPPVSAPTAAVEAPGPPPSTIVVNQPAALPAEPKPEAAPAPPPAPEKPAAETSLARVWVQVPTSFYYLKALPNRNPSAEDLQPFVTRTESLIRTAVDHVIPPNGSELKIDTIPDHVASRYPLEAPAVPETRRTLSWWVPAGVGGSVAAASLVIGGALLVAARRPKAVPAPDPARVQYTRDDRAEAGHGPSERVRELIRRNPEAAASVLHRWIGQGGHAG